MVFYLKFYLKGTKDVYYGLDFYIVLNEEPAISVYDKSFCPTFRITASDIN